MVAPCRICLNDYDTLSFVFAGDLFKKLLHLAEFTLARLLVRPAIFGEFIAQRPFVMKD